jgi:hypothetical protein
MTKPVLLSTLLLGLAFFCARSLHSQDAPSRTADVPRVTESEEQLGSLALGGQTFTVKAHSQTISRASNARFATTVSSLEILNANAGAVYEETFPTSIADGRFMQTLTVSASVQEGAGGRALILHFVEDPASPGGAESWQMFGLVNGKLASYGPPLPLGQGSVPINGVLTGVMVSGGIGVVPLASTAEALEFRVWAGNFFLNVPVRIDWPHGQWSEGEQCFATEGGTLHPVGCNLSVIPVRVPVAEGATVTLYQQPEENAYSARQISVHPGSAMEFPAARALVKWQTSGDRFTCSFDDLWLRVKIDGNEGWVHSATDFTALGLASSIPGK